MTRDELRAFLLLTVQSHTTSAPGDVFFSEDWLNYKYAAPDKDIPTEAFIRWDDAPEKPWGFVVAFHPDREMYAVGLDYVAPKRSTYHKQTHHYSPNEVYTIITNHFKQENLYDTKS